MKKRHAALAVIALLGVGLGATAYLASPTVHEGLPGDAPELGRPGDFAIGTEMADYVLPGRVNITAWGALTGNVETAERRLSVRFWYPAEQAADKDPIVYTHQITPIGQEPVALRYQGRATLAAAPLTEQKFPLVLMSHGFGGWHAQFSNLGEHIASHGYVVASIEHADQKVDSLPSFLLSFGNVLANRALDQQQVLDQILRQASAGGDGPLVQIDREKVGLIGYSMGGYGALATSGAPYDYSKEPMSNLPDAAREAIQQGLGEDSPVDALITIAPWGGQPDNRAWTAAALSRIEQPVLILSGSEDDVVNHREGVSWIFDSLSGSDRHMLVYREARHNIAGNDFTLPPGSGFQAYEFLTEPVWRNERINAINQHFVTAFLDLHLKGDEAKAAYLDVPVKDSNGSTWPVGMGEQLNGTPAGDEQAEHWRGFQRRWAVGLEMHRAGADTE